MENQRFDAEGTDLNVFVPFNDHILVKSFLKSRFLILSQTTNNFEESDCIGGLLLYPEQIVNLINIIEFALPHTDIFGKRELQAYSKLLLDLKCVLDESKVVIQR